MTSSPVGRSPRHARSALVIRSALAVAAALVLVACGSGSDNDADSLPEITLLPTTAPPPTQPPVVTDVETTVVETTTTTTTTTTSVVVTTVAPAPTTTVDETTSALTLTETGLGEVLFGADPDGVIAYVSSLLGEPTSDTGWVDPFTIGPCIGTQLRIVTWGVLSLTFGDASTVLEGQPHFFAYSYGFDGEVGAEPAGLATIAGVTIGSPVVDVLAAYPGVMLNPEDDFVSANFVVSDNLRGFVTGLADDDTVTVILGGIGCGE